MLCSCVITLELLYFLLIWEENGYSTLKDNVKAVEEIPVFEYIVASFNCVLFKVVGKDVFVLHLVVVEVFHESEVVDQLKDLLLVCWT